MDKKRLTEKECYELFEKYETPAHVRRHCRAVADVAVRFARELNAKGFSFDEDLVRGAGLIHDVVRLEERHDLAGARILEELGYHDEAEIVKAHMRLQFRPLSEADETDMVVLSDRLVKENAYVGLDERILYLMNKFGNDPKINEHLLGAKEKTRDFMGQIEKVIGRSIDSLFRPSLDEILKRVEKPARYIGGETNMVVKDPSAVDIRFAFAFPDLYEIGMSYMGMQILYDITNKMDNVYCERTFAPALDMEEMMRKEGIELFTLETKTPIREMDVLGFTLQYEMSYTNILNMLELSGMPILAKDRGDDMPLVVAGGPCAYNPEPLADFFDLFMIGDGEELLPDVLEKCAQAKKNGTSREDLLKELSTLTGVYIPSFYMPVYREDGVIERIDKLWEGAPDKVRRAIIDEVENAPFPRKNIVPIIEAVHERAVVETFRGCTRGCRFCQAGMIYRPIRERSKETIMSIVKDQLDSTGHDELSILSLSTSDYSDFEGLTVGLMDYCRERNVSLSLPSLRLDSFSFKVLDEIQKYKKSGLTFAPEAGTQRMRNIINKGVNEEDIYSAVSQAIDLGWTHIKLYFMDGLPYETFEDLEGIADIARKILRIRAEKGAKGRFSITISVSNFVPKAHTPFQWMAQDTEEVLAEKHKYLIERTKMKAVRLTYHDEAVSKCEAVFARGDRRTGGLLMLAHEAGCKLDAWGEHFDPEVWEKLYRDWEIDYRFYTNRKRSYDEILPWDIIDSGISKTFLMREAEKAKRMEVTPDCRKGCAGCGINRYTTCRHGGIYG